MLATPTCARSTSDPSDSAYDRDDAWIGIRHRSAVGKLIMGSVAQRVIIDDACPLVADKP